MKRLAAIILLSVVLMAPSKHGINTDRPLPTYVDSLTCVEVIELYDEAGSLFEAAGMRIKEVRSPAARKFWTEIRQFTLSLHPVLLQARSQKCKAA